MRPLLAEDFCFFGAFCGFLLFFFCRGLQIRIRAFYQDSHSFVNTCHPRSNKNREKSEGEKRERKREKTYDKPVGNLVIREIGLIRQIILVLRGWVRVVHVVIHPFSQHGHGVRPEIVSAFPLACVDEGCGSRIGLIVRIRERRRGGGRRSRGIGSRCACEERWSRLISESKTAQECQNETNT